MPHSTSFYLNENKLRRRKDVRIIYKKATKISFSKINNIYTLYLPILLQHI